MTSTHHNLRFVVSRSDVGSSGLVSGATLLDWIDRTAYTVAAQWSGRPCVAASIGTFHLDRPITVGELVDLNAVLVYTGRSSMHILVTVCSFDPAFANGAQSAQCPIIFVSVGSAGDPLDVPALAPVTMLELQRHRQARSRIRMRRRIDQEMADQRYTPDGTAPRTTRRLRVPHTDVDPDSRVSGGRVMRWIDDAACAGASDWTGGQAVTSYIAGIRLCGPVFGGEVVEVTSRVIHTGPRSVHSAFHVTANRQGRGRCEVAHGVSVAVLLGGCGDAQPVPQWKPASDEDHRLDQHARDLIELRQFVEPFPAAAVPSRQ